MPGFGLGFGMRSRRIAASAPDGALIDNDNAYLLDEDGANLLEDA